MNNLLLLSFLNKWTPITRLLQSGDVLVMAVNSDNTQLQISTTKFKELFTDFDYEMFDVNCVYSSIDIGGTTFLKIYHK